MKTEDVSRYVVRDKKSGVWRYYRRIPTEVALLDRRTHVKRSLKTRYHKEALERAESIHKAAETLWRAMLAGNDNQSAVAQYAAAVKAAQSLGFTYQPAAQAAEGDISEVYERLKIAQENYGKSPLIVSAVLGTALPPAPKLSNVWELYEEHNRAGLLGMSPKQLEKHKVSRERAIRYAKDVMGDLELSKIARPDVLKLREWWTDKIQQESLKADSANRSFSDIGGMLSAIDVALHTEYHKPWERVRIKVTNATKEGKRAAFTREWVQDKILRPGALDSLNEDARLIIYAAIETGARPGEICNLRPQDIRLQHDVPHIEIAERDDRRQKTEHSIRRVPLVGVSLWAMERRPNGFPRYADNGDSFSAIANKVMRSSGLCPTDKHTVYSIRHCFQDRIENAGASDRMQADLMGHQLGRPTYGDGPEMKRRQEFLDRIKLKWPG
ncbi:site-specific integrase [Agrobacterium tumefaciens]|uniref:site-specific integrase n=1 Tax=Agrobacterium tumefaciens TaxID=358 RepID=UPI001574D8A9|nr:site-specific integrase [Agrobacterium tumefaciens]NSX90385.1 tyrosine-type recombinase/integrase [Agrobacterium tumefaciens]